MWRNHYSCTNLQESNTSDELELVAESNLINSLSYSFLQVIFSDFRCFFSSVSSLSLCLIFGEHLADPSAYMLVHTHSSLHFELIPSVDIC